MEQFTKRGKADRTAALRQALETTRSRIAEQQKLISNASLLVSEAPPKEQAGLSGCGLFRLGVTKDL